MNLANQNDISHGSGHERIPQGSAVFGIILAGGKSSRMGCDKANLVWQGQTLLERQFVLLRNLLGENHVVVSGDRSGYTCVLDESPNLGPIEGFRSALKSLLLCRQEIMVMVTPVDMPHIDQGVFLSLYEHRNLGEAVKFRGFELPVLFTNTKKVAAVLDELCQINTDRSLRSFQNLFSALAVFEIPHGLTTMFANTNTKEEWHEAISETNHSPRG